MTPKSKRKLYTAEFKAEVLKLAPLSAENRVHRLMGWDNAVVGSVLHSLKVEAIQYKPMRN